MEIKKIFLRIAAGSALLLTLAACGNDKGEAYIGFAQCLSDKGVKMYGSFRCSHCAAQKELFGSSFQYVTYVECDPLSRVADLSQCKAQNIDSYPTWIFPDGSRALGEQTFDKLSEKSSCPLPQTTETVKESDATTTSTSSSIPPASLEATVSTATPANE